MKPILTILLAFTVLAACKKESIKPNETGLIISIEKGNMGVWSMIDIWDTQGHQMAIEPISAMSGYAMDKVLNHNVEANYQTANAYYKIKLPAGTYLVFVAISPTQPGQFAYSYKTFTVTDSYVVADKKFSDNVANNQYEAWQ